MSFLASHHDIMILSVAPLIPRLSSFNNEGQVEETGDGQIGRGRQTTDQFYGLTGT